MDVRLKVPDLKRKVVQEVGFLCRRNGFSWNAPVLEVLQDLRELNTQAVLFGGALRSLLVSRIYWGRPGRPRDIDLVVSGVSLSRLEEQFRKIVVRRTRFGGLRLKHGAWQFDVWPVGETWAFKRDRSNGASFAGLPATTAFNLEAIAVETWPRNGGSRSLFSDNDQFFDGILARTVELNRPDNPFPELTVIRALVLACELNFHIGPKLVEYIKRVGVSMSEEVVERVQVSHYGYARMQSSTLYGLIARIAERACNGRTWEVPALGQMPLRPATTGTTGTLIGFRRTSGAGSGRRVARAVG